MVYTHNVTGSSPVSCTNGLLHPKQFYAEVLREPVKKPHICMISSEGRALAERVEVVGSSPTSCTAYTARTARKCNKFLLFAQCTSTW